MKKWKVKRAKILSFVKKHIAKILLVKILIILLIFSAPLKEVTADILSDLRAVSLARVHDWHPIQSRDNQTRQENYTFAVVVRDTNTYQGNLSAGFLHNATLNFSALMEQAGVNMTNMQFDNQSVRIYQISNFGICLNSSVANFTNYGDPTNCPQLNYTAVIV